MIVGKSKLETFFVLLNRFNAIGIGIALLWLIGVGGAGLYSLFQEPPPEYFGDKAHKVRPYAGEEIQTMAGPVAAYGIGNQGDGPGISQSPNLSLVNLASGRKRMILPDDGKKRIIRFETIYGAPDSPKPLARAYVALAVDAADTAEAKIDLIVGTLPDLNQATLARNVSAVDLATLYGSDRLAVIIWPKPDRAQLVTIDLGNLQVEATEVIPLPKPRDTKVTNGSGEPAGGAAGAAPANKFEF